jgi:hypothetical protein
MILQNMNDSLDYRLSNFVREIDYLSRPDNPGKVYLIKELLSEVSIEDLCYILIQLIEDKENDNSLIRLEDDFKTHLITIIECSSLDNLPIAIEGLAQKYESFLKKIGYLKYQGTDYWSGNAISSGLTGTTLKMLCDGNISNKYGKEDYEPLKLDNPIINYKGVARSLIDFMRTNLRNAVHYAPNINRKHLIPYSEIVIVIYLLAIQDNIKLLGPRYLSRLALRKKILSTHDSIEKSYVKNKFSENSPENLIQFEPRLKESSGSIKEDGIEKREGTITEIFSKVNQFIIKGIGGLGKTTTLRFFSNHLIKNENITPLFFPLKDFRNGTNLIDQILLESGITLEEFESDLKYGTKYVFLLDGINEIIDLKKRSELLIELKLLLKKYKSCGTVLSSRKIPELIQLNLPIFNIQALDIEGIVEFVEKNFIELSSTLIPRLNQSERLLRLCSNPLLLQILCTIYHNEDLKITNNEALIIKAFVNNTLERERLKNHKIDIEKLSHYLMDLGYHTRFNASVSFSQYKTIEILSKSSEQISPLDDKIEILELFKDLNFINQTAQGLSFNHELYQEYFAAEGLIYYGTTLSELQTIDHWRNPILMYSGLADQRHEFISDVATSDTFLAAECLMTSIVDENEIEQDIAEKSIRSMSNSNDISSYSRGVLALLKLKRYVELKENLPTKPKDLGDLVRPRVELEGVSIVQTIIRELDSKHLLDFIQVLLDKDISYRNDIVRGLLDRDTDELKPVIDIILDLVMNTVNSDINTTNLLNLIKLFGVDNVKIRLVDNLSNMILKRILIVKSINSPAIIIANELDLFRDVSGVCNLIEEADANIKEVKSFLKMICDHFFTSDSDRKRIFKSASRSKNLLIYLTGCVYVAQNGYKSSEVLFERYNVFSNKRLTYILRQTNRNFNSSILLLETEILRWYGPHKELNKLVGKTLTFEIKARNTQLIRLTTLINDDFLNATWIGKNAINFIQNGDLKKQNTIELTVTNVDCHKGLLIVDQKEPNTKSCVTIKPENKSYSNKTIIIRKPKETLLGSKLRDALRGIPVIPDEDKPN